MSNPYIADTPNFPPEMTARKQWIAFRLQPNPGGKLGKTPIDVETGTFASSNAPESWSTYETALAAVKAGTYDALGFVLTPDTQLVILDLENCIEGGEIAEWAQREVDALNSFTEISASQTGLHVLCWGEIPSNLNRQKVRAELWDRDKMFALTGITLPGKDAVKQRSFIELHGRIDRGEIGPDYQPPRIPLNVKSPKFTDSCEDRWQNHYGGRSEAVQGVLCSLAAEHGDDADAIREVFEQTELCKNWFGANGEWKWARLGDKEIARAISHVTTETAKAKAEGRYAPATAAGPTKSLEFTRPAIRGRAKDYVLLAKEGSFSGWFPRSGISLVGGSSGAGKTTLVIDVLERQARKETVLGHEGAGLPYLIICDDRGKFDNVETLERMRLDPDRIPIRFVDTEWGVDAAASILECIEAQPEIPAVVFVEGADMMVEDPNRIQMVTTFLKAIKRIAEHYHMALVLSVGAPKSKPQEQYALKRDRIFGSQAWPRRAATVIIVARKGEESAIREISVEHRNAESEVFEMEFQNGRLVQRVAPASPDVDPVRAWIERKTDGEEWFTRPEAVKAMETNGTGLKKSPVYERLKKMVDTGVLEEDHSSHVTRLRIVRTAAEREGRKLAATVNVW